ncbi:MAG: triose-phosphate isomerase family protein [bacterium]|nr:triose-phosphate isomerase family protein [bacterium]
MAKPILVANWKNNPKALSEVKTLLKQLSRDQRFYKKLTLFIAPPLPFFESISLRAASFAHLASQDISVLTNGTHTGAVTVDILKGFGTRLAILGHSEQRALGETSEEVSEKVKIALRSGITPLVCVGELSRDHDGEHFEFLRQQVKLSLAGFARRGDAAKIALAYEPVWAIGQRAISAIEPLDLAQSVIFIRKVLTDMFGRVVAERVPILYGGSVEPNNASALLRGTGIKGFLVGRASLNAKSFRSIAESLTSK